MGIGKKIKNTLGIDKCSFDIKNYNPNLLFQSISKFDNKSLEYYVKHKVDLNIIQNNTGSTILHHAVSVINKDAINILLTNEPNLINKKDFYGNTALHFASYIDDLELLNTILQYCNDEDIIIKNGIGNTALHFSACNSSKNLKLLIEDCNPKDVSIRNENGNTPLHVAISAGNEKSFNLLIEAGADVNIRNKHYEIPLHNTMLIDDKNFLDVQIRMVKKLIEKGSDIYVNNSLRHTPLHLSINRKVSEILAKKYCNLSDKDQVNSVINIMKDILRYKFLYFFVNNESVNFELLSSLPNKVLLLIDNINPINAKEIYYYFDEKEYFNAKSIFAFKQDIKDLLIAKTHSVSTQKSGYALFDSDEIKTDSQSEGTLMGE